MFWGKKKEEPAAAGGAPVAPSPAKGGEVVYSPEKARKFFEHARTVQETGNPEYAMQLWLGGLRFDPGNMDGVTAFFGCAAQFLETDAKGKGPGKDVVNSVGGKENVDKYLRGLLEWAMKPTEGSYAVRALEAASAMRLKEPCQWIGDRALGAVLKDKKVRKDLLLKIADSFKSIDDADRAVRAAEEAVKIDPSDGELAAYVRNLAATATMNRGGYTQTSGTDGGFRSNIRDAKKQQLLEEGDRLVKTEDTVERLLKAAEEDHAKRPQDLPAIEVLCKRLLERGKPKDEIRAYELYMSTFEWSKQFRFREMAGDIKIRQNQKKIRDLERMLEGTPGNEMLTNMLASAREDLLKLEAEEFALRVEAYPTDIGRKFELGKRYFQLEKYDEAIGLFQESQQDVKLRPASLNYMGQAFFKIKYYDEAEASLRQALESGDMAPEFAIELRYSLLSTLLEIGKASKNVEKLRDADKIASQIAMKQFNYKDVRAKREEIKGLIAELGG
jgi:tetratricopeptide (TPR) repeat protein